MIRGIISLLLMLFAIRAGAQQLPADTVKKITGPDSKWAFAVDGYYYIVPGDKNSSTLIGSADYKALHLETRYNYEGLNTASVFGGYNFEAGNKLSLSVTPMLGFVFGDTKGIIPALELELAWKKFDFYAESELVVDFEGKKNDYFYMWSELAITPIKNLRAGIAASRTVLYQSQFDFQRGIFAQYSFWKLITGIYYFNPLTQDNFVIATLGIEF